MPPLNPFQLGRLKTTALFLGLVFQATQTSAITACASSCGTGPSPIVPVPAIVVGPFPSGPVISPIQSFNIQAGGLLIGTNLEVVFNATTSIQQSSQSMNGNLTSLSTALNGAHSRPLSRLVDIGEKTAWVAGDWGVDNHDSRNGNLGLAELGVGYRYQHAQVNIAIGKTWSDNDTIIGGDTDADGKFVLVETIIPIPQVNGLYATLSGYYHEGKIDSKRGYLNASVADASFASPDSRASGLRVRLDWQDAYQWQAVKFTPYLDANFSHAHIDSFTETGGGFPASFGSRDEAITELRVGFNSAMALQNCPVELLVNLEAAHRFDDRGVTTTGQISGFFSGFDVVGSDYDQDWIKAGIGIEGELGKGKASLMLNGTTEGEMPSAWAAFSYQVAF